MKRTILFYILLTSTALTSIAQDVIEVTDQTLKIAPQKDEELYFGFAEGDKIIFNFHEVDKKELKEMEIVEYPSNSKFSDFKTSKVENKTFTATRKCIYVFKFKNGAITGRLCKIKISRIPASDATKNFNSAVTWVNQPDTSWSSYSKDVLVGYDTAYEWTDAYIFIFFKRNILSFMPGMNDVAVRLIRGFDGNIFMAGSVVRQVFIHFLETIVVLCQAYIQLLCIPSEVYTNNGYDITFWGKT